MRERLIPYDAPYPCGHLGGTVHIIHECIGMDRLTRMVCQQGHVTFRFTDPDGHERDLDLFGNPNDRALYQEMQEAAQ